MLQPQRYRGVVDLDSVGVESVTKVDRRCEDGEGDGSKEPAEAAGRLAVDDRRQFRDLAQHVCVDGGGVEEAWLPKLAHMLAEVLQELWHASRRPPARQG